MAVQTLPLSIDHIVHSGTGYERRYRWKPAGQPQNFTDWTAVMLVGPYRGFALAELHTPDDLQLGTDGMITIGLDADRTASLPAGSYVYQLDLIDPAGAPMRFLRGRITIIRDLEPGP